MSNQKLQVNTRLSPNRGTVVRKRIDMIVVHATAGKMPGCLEWLCNPKSKVSAHYLIDKLGNVYEMVPPEYTAWHAGRSEWKGESDCNRFSIGIELENDNKGELYPVAQIDNLKILIRYLMIKYGIKKERVVGHNEIAPKRKTDPFGLNMNKLREAV